MRWIVFSVLAAGLTPLLISDIRSQNVAAPDRGRNPAARPDRSRPPSSWDSETERLFQGDPFQAVRGKRPEQGAERSSAVKSPGVLPDRDGERRTTAWSQFITVETLADEIKSQFPALGDNVRRVGSFKSGGHRDVERQYAVIAAMFGIIAEHVESGRWKDIAPSARDAFARASANAKSGSSDAYNDSKTRYEDLGELIRGESVEFEEPKEDVVWSRLADRRLLMQRLEQGHTERLKPFVATQAEFEKNRLAVIHEAEIIAAIAEIIQQEEYEFYDDDEYCTFCKQLQKQAQQLALAAQENNLAELQLHLGEMTKSCSACHEGYK